MSHTTLRKVVAEQNMRRQYSVSVQLDLFGAAWVVCRWGRIGSAGQVREHPCESLEAAETLAARLVDAKQHRGYCLAPKVAAWPPSPGQASV